MLSELGEGEVTVILCGFDPKDPETSAHFLTHRLCEADGPIPEIVAGRAASQKHIAEQRQDASALTIRRIQQEFKTQQRPGIAVEMVDDNIFHWRALILGPADTPYASCVFECHVIIPSNYPVSAPEVYFATEIYHCNVDTEGWLQQDLVGWHAGWTIVSFLLLIVSLLADPVLECPANPEAAAMCRLDRAAYDVKAKECALEHAAISI
jgi:ubiquitin-conjugating enzyme E2 D/E